MVFSKETENQVFRFVVVTTTAAVQHVQEMHRPPLLGAHVGRARPRSSQLVQEIVVILACNHGRSLLNLQAMMICPSCNQF
jgi:hypothetical protein